MEIENRSGSLRWETRQKNRIGTNDPRIVGFNKVPSIPGWSEWFAGMTRSQTESGDTLLSGPVVDQAALHGLLARIRDLNLTLIAVERIESSQQG